MGYVATESNEILIYRNIFFTFIAISNISNLKMSRLRMNDKRGSFAFFSPRKRKIYWNSSLGGKAKCVWR